MKRILMAAARLWTELLSAAFNLNLQTKMIAVFVFLLSLPILAVSFIAYRHYADLSEALLTGANMLGCNLLGANLSRAELDGAVLLGANLDGAVLAGANLHKAVVSTQRLLTIGRLDDAILPNGNVLIFSGSAPQTIASD